MRYAAILMALVLFACGDDDDDGDDDAPVVDAGAPDVALAADAGNPLLEARPYNYNIPASYDPGTPAPLVLVLHGYSANGFVQSRLFGLIDGSEEHGFLLAYPDGLYNSKGTSYWNATDACCDVDGTNVDDVAYLSAVVDDMEAKYNVDPKRIYVVGHSNGGYMAHRLACDTGDRFAAIISLAGMVWKDPTKCPAEAHVSVLQIHGTADDTVLFEGSSYYPSAIQTVTTWAEKNGCSGALAEDGVTMDMDVGVDGAETTLMTFAGCPVDGEVKLWEMTDAGHIPSVEATVWAAAMWGFLSAHARP